MVQGGPVVQITVILLSILGLWVGARLLVDSAVRLARRFGLSDITIGLTIVAMGTSTPELSVSVDAALKGLGDIAVGNIIGSNIYNLAFILGVISVLRVIPIAESFVRRNGVALLGATLVGAVAIFDLQTTRLEGGLLAGLFVAYTAYLLRASQAEEPTSHSFEEADITRQLTEQVRFRGRDVVFLVGGLAVVLVSGDYMVRAASELARGAGISELVIGGTIVAAGTSTPEFAVSLVAIQRRSLGVSVGNIVGSNIYNITGILGVAALVRPLGVSSTALWTLAWLAGVTLLMVAALWTERALSRVEGALFATAEIARWILGILR